MRCSEVQEKLSSYIDGMLPAVEMRAVDEHLSLCPDCREELRLLEGTVEFLRDLEEVEPPADLPESIMAALPSPSGKKRRGASLWHRLKGRPMGGFLAAAACLLLVAVLLGRGLPRVGSNGGVKVAPESTVASLDAGAEVQRGAVALADRTIPQEDTASFSGQSQKPALTEEGMAETAERKVIKRAHLTVLVEDLDREFEQIVALVEGIGGFVQHSGTWEDDGQWASNLTVRVPADKFSWILAQIEELGRVERKELDGQDVTTEYVDTEARLRNLKRQEERFLEILDRAQTVEDILSIERELERVRGEIEALTAHLKNIENLTTYATINIKLRELKVSAQHISPPALQGVLTAAAQAAVSTVNFMLTFLGEVVIFLGWIVPLIPIAVLAWFGYRRYKGKKTGKE